MNPNDLEKLLKGVAKGEMKVPEAMSKLRLLPFKNMGFANIDHHRMLRTGLPEVVYGESKSTEQIITISQHIISQKMPLFVTRIDENKAAKILEAIPEVTHDPVSRTIRHLPPGYKRRKRGMVAVVTAGTSDIPVAEEAAITLEIMGERVERIFDVGVAGIHRLFHQLPRLQKARAVIVAAGMEGALASIVGGLVACPIVALPTSVGYGANLGGISALLGMLTSCAPGVTVVNIDNGFGAAAAAGLINRRGAQ